METNMKVLSRNYFCTQLYNRVQVYTIGNDTRPKKCVECRTVEDALRWVAQYGES